jgi:hypothetical protein
VVAEGGGGGNGRSNDEGETPKTVYSRAFESGGRTRGIEEEEEEVVVDDDGGGRQSTTVDKKKEKKTTTTTKVFTASRPIVDSEVGVGLLRSQVCPNTVFLFIFQLPSKGGRLLERGHFF